MGEGGSTDLPDPDAPDIEVWFNIEGKDADGRDIGATLRQSFPLSHWPRPPVKGERMFVADCDAMEVEFLTFYVDGSIEIALSDSMAESNTYDSAKRAIQIAQSQGFAVEELVVCGRPCSTIPAD